MFSSSAVISLTSECVEKGGRIITVTFKKLAEIMEQLNITRTRGALAQLSSK